MKDLSLFQIIQSIKGESFEWWLHILADGRAQALWREPISGALGRTEPITPSKMERDFDGNLDQLGEYAYYMRRERIATIDEVEFQLDSHGGHCIASWLDADSGLVRKARVKSERRCPSLIPDADILVAANTPLFWMD